MPQHHSTARWSSLSVDSGLTKAKPIFLGEDTGCGKDLVKGRCLGAPWSHQWTAPSLIPGHQGWGVLLAHENCLEAMFAVKPSPDSTQGWFKVRDQHVQAKVFRNLSLFIQQVS